MNTQINKSPYPFNRSIKIISTEDAKRLLDEMSVQIKDSINEFECLSGCTITEVRLERYDNQIPFGDNAVFKVKLTAVLGKTVTL